MTPTNTSTRRRSVVKATNNKYRRDLWDYFAEELMAALMKAQEIQSKGAT